MPRKKATSKPTSRNLRGKDNLWFKKIVSGVEKFLESPFK